MAKLTPEQLRTRARVERLIGLMAPGLNLILALGERVSLVVEADDPDYYPVRSNDPGAAAKPPPAGYSG